MTGRSIFRPNTSRLKPELLVREGSMVIQKVVFGLPVNESDIFVLISLEALLRHCKPTDPYRSRVGLDRVVYVLSYVRERAKIPLI